MRRPGRLLSALLRRGRLERDMSDEMAHHLASEIEDRIARGMSPAEARRTATRDFGGVERWKEEGRASRGVGGWDAIRQDLRYALRTLRGSPGFLVVAVLTLALGIGATTTLFSVVDGVLLSPLGYDAPDRIVRLLEYDEDGGGRGTITAPNFFDWMAESRSFEAAALYDEYRPTLRLRDRVVKLEAASVGARYFDVLGLRPQLGRFFLPEEEEGGASRVVLSDGLWREVFAADPAVLGRTIDLGGFPYTIVGVAPAFEDPGLSGSAFAAPRLWRSPPSYFYTNSRGSRSFTAIARLAGDAGIDAAVTELRAIHARLTREYPEENVGHHVQVVPLKTDLVGDVASLLWILFGCVGLVLLIACANVANLLLFRAAGRGREIALRTALGASRRRVIRQLLVESALLGVTGAAAGVLVAIVATRGLVTLAAGHLPRLEQVTVDPAVLAFALAAGFGAALLFGLLPALHTARPDAAAALRDGGRGSGSGSGRLHGRIRRTVVAGEVALAVVVMLGAGLLGRSLLRLQAVDPGVAADHALVLRIDPPFDPFDPGTEAGGEALLQLQDRLSTRLAAIPGIQHVGITDLLPMSGSFNGNGFRIVGQPEPGPGQAPTAETRAIDAGYFPALGIPIREGRGVQPTDGTASRDVVVVNETFARRWLPGGALGHQLLILGGPPADIVGVVGDVTQFSLDEDPIPTVYVPHAQAPAWMRDEPWIVLRTGLEPASLAPQVRAAIQDIEPRTPVYEVATMRQVVDRTLTLPRFRTILLLAFAGLAFLLAAIGVYGMVAYTVARRLPEIGIRMALGADAGRIRRLVLGESLRPVLFGAAAGLLLGLVVVRIVAGFLYGVSATDPATFFAVPTLLGAVAALAAIVGGRRAARLQPSSVLRAD